MRWVKRFAGSVVLGRQMRVDIYLTIGDLLTSGFALEKAFAIVISTLKDEAQGLRGVDPEALEQRRSGGAASPQEVDAWVPASEAMLFVGIRQGRCDGAVRRRRPRDGNEGPPDQRARRGSGHARRCCFSHWS